MSANYLLPKLILLKTYILIQVFGRNSISRHLEASRKTWGLYFGGYDNFLLLGNLNDSIFEPDFKNHITDNCSKIQIFLVYLDNADDHYFPSILVHANITPTFQKKYGGLKEIYYLINILPAISKIFEKNN